MDKLKEWYRHEHIGTLGLFILVCLVLLGVLEKNFVLTSEVVYQHVSEKFGHLPEASIRKIAKSSNIINAFNYAIVAITMTISIFFFAVTLQPLLVSSSRYSPKVPLEPIIRVLLISHLATLAMYASKVLYFAFFVDKLVPAKYAWFVPVSVTTLFGASNLPRWAIGLLNSLNLFEVLFTLSLGYGLSVALENRRAFWVGVLVNVVITIIFSLFASVLSAD
jgi:hypothetical protein